RPFPISIDYDSHQEMADAPEVDERAEGWKKRLGLNGHQFVGIGIDRIDYTKGIAERFRAIDLFLERYPEFREKLVFVTVGVLILSRFTGAARELSDALLINPFAVEQSVEAIHQALSMPEGDRRRRMQRMRDAVSHNNIYRWAGKIVSALLKFEFAESTSWE